MYSCATVRMTSEYTGEISDNAKLTILVNVFLETTLLRYAGLERTLLVLHPLLVGYATRNLCEKISNTKSCLWTLLELKYISYSLSKWRFSLSLKDHEGPPIMSIVEPRMANKLWAHSSISFIHMTFWCLFLDPHLSTRHSNTGVRLRWVTEFGRLR